MHKISVFVLMLAAMFPRFVYAIASCNMDVSQSKTVPYAIVVNFNSCGVGGCDPEITNTFLVEKPFSVFSEITQTQSEVKIRGELLTKIVENTIKCFNDSRHDEHLSSSLNDVICESDSAHNLAMILKDVRNRDIAHLNHDKELSEKFHVYQMSTVIGAFSGRRTFDDPKLRFSEKTLSLPTSFLYPARIEAIKCSAFNDGWKCMLTTVGDITWAKH